MSRTIFKLEKIKTKGNFSGRQIHNFGLKDCARPNADKSLTGLNRVLINEDNKNYLSLFNRRIKEVEMEKGECRVRKNAVLAYEIVLGYSTDDHTFSLSDRDFSRWQAENIKFLKDTFGEKNVVSAVLHVDEEYPHIHAIVIPIDEEGKLNARKITGQRKNLFNMQKDYAERMSNFGIDKGTTYAKADKKELKRFYSDAKKNVNLSLPEKEEDETISCYADRVKSWAVTEKNKSLAREKKLERRANDAEAKLKQIYVENRQAILLNQLLLRRYKGSKRKNVSNIFEKLLNIVNEVPTEIMEKSLELIYKKYGGDNILVEDNSYFKNTTDEMEKGDEIIGENDSININDKSTLSEK